MTVHGGRECKHCGREMCSFCIKDHEKYCHENKEGIMDTISIILDEKDPTKPIFVEIENAIGEEINIGTRTTTEEGYTKLTISVNDIVGVVDDTLESERAHGRNLATLLVKHLINMCAVKLNILIDVGGRRYTVSVK